VDNESKCPVTGKRQYATEGEALATAAHQIATANAPKDLRAYLCSWCDAWHITKIRQIRKGSHVASSLSTSRRHTRNSRPVASLARTWASELQLRQIITPNQPQHQSRSGVSTSHTAKIIFKAAARGRQNPRQRQTKLFASQALAPCSGLAPGSGISMPSSFALALTTDYSYVIVNL